MATRRSINRKEPEEQAVAITRVFDAPREVVWKAWTDCERLTRWWGPKDFTTPHCKIDLRQGGVFQNCMRSAEGRDYCGKGVYREIIDRERITYTDFFVDEQGNPVSAAHYGLSAEWPEETLVAVTLAEHNGKTELTLQHTIGSVPASELDLCYQGWNESFDKLAGELAKDLKQEGKMDMQAMMDVYTKLGTPGPPHKLLESMAGSWTAKVKSWCEFEKSATESAGTSEQKMVLGGRFLQQEFTAR